MSTRAQPATPELVGIGVLFEPEPKSLLVKALLPDGGGAAAGIVIGDRVIGVDGIAVAKLGPEGTINKCLGAGGTTVNITLWRNGAAVTLVVERKKQKRKLSLDFGNMSEVLERKISPLVV